MYSGGSEGVHAKQEIGLIFRELRENIEKWETINNSGIITSNILFKTKDPIQEVLKKQKVVKQEDIHRPLLFIVFIVILTSYLKVITSYNKQNFLPISRTMETKICSGKVLGI